VEDVRDVASNSTLRLVEEGCIEVYTLGGKLVPLATLRAVCAQQGALPADFTLVVTDKGRDALARGRP